MTTNESVKRGGGEGSAGARARGVCLLLALLGAGCDDKIMCPGAAYPRTRGECELERRPRDFTGESQPSRVVAAAPAARVLARTETPESIPWTLLHVELENTSAQSGYHVSGYRFTHDGQSTAVDADFILEPGAKAERNVRLAPGTFANVDVSQVRVEVKGEPAPGR